jgi:hypothetical protein
MSDETKHGNTTGHGDFEHRDISAAPVLYFLAALAFSGLVIHFIVTGVFHELEKRNEEQQTAVSPLVTNAPKDTRHLPPEYNGNYEEYLKKNFPAPQLETDERTQLNSIITQQEQELNSYGYIDQKAGTVRIPIDRAMDLLAQRGLPVRGQATTNAPVSAMTGDTKTISARTSNKKTKESKQ